MSAHFPLASAWTEETRQLVEAFEAGALPPGSFGHRDHVHLSWAYFRRYDPEEAGNRIAAGLRAFAARVGHASTYHETITRFWCAVVEWAVGATPHLNSFDVFAERHPFLLDKGILVRHYSREVLASPEARARFVQPDLVPLPALEPTG